MPDYRLLTPYGERLDPASVLPEYPRPQLVRDRFLNLNGVWERRVRKPEQPPGQPDGTILVPFPLESCLSGAWSGEVPLTLQPDETLIYTRTVDVPEDFLQAVTLLHLDAADQTCRVTVNGVDVGGHEGGYLPAVLDVSKAVRPGKNIVEIRVRDPLSFDLPTGKQRRKRGGIWYTPVSGIWQTVWMESVPKQYVKALRLTPDIDRETVTIQCDTDAPGFRAVVSLRGEQVCEGEAQGNRLTLPVPSPALWSPDSPVLYDLTIIAGEDAFRSYFAMRKFSTDGQRFLLNNQPVFINGLLDQGYFSDGIYTPASYDAYRDDILTAKALGFNALRKHIKIEPMMFYHLCDALGMLVLQDMVNVGKYSFFKDTVLPFAGLRGLRPYVNVRQKQRACFARHALETVQYLQPCPCVVYYTIFNEGWGQFDGDGMYRRLKAADPTRVYDATSGWFRERESDVWSDHIYFRPIRPPKKTGGRPWIVSEFGGYSHSVKGHTFDEEAEFGYRKYRELEAFRRDFLLLYEREVLGNIGNGLAGAVYTQVSDVEDETNGVLTYDRRMCKLAAAEVRALMKKLPQA